MLKRASIVLVASVLLTGIPGCTPSQAPAPTVPGPSPITTPAPAPEKPAAAPTQGKDPAGKSTGEVPAKPLPPVLEELRRKLQPALSDAKSPAKAPEPTAAPSTAHPTRRFSNEEAAKLLPAAEELAAKLDAALRKGEVEAAVALCVAEKDMEKVLNPGYLEILAGNLLPQNKESLNAYAGTLKGKTSKSTFKVGEITEGPATGAFKPGLPIMSGAQLLEDVDGVRIEIRLEQLVHLDGEWKIFRVRSP